MAEWAWILTRNHRAIAAATDSSEPVAARAELIVRQVHGGDIRWDQHVSTERRLMTRSRTTGGWHWSTYSVLQVPLVAFEAEKEG